jgi:hypothetical protein
MRWPLGAPRSKIFKRDAPKTQSLSDIKTLVRSNAYLTDPLAVNPTRSAMNAVSARGDLFLTNVTQPFYLLPSCMGGIDAKITNNVLMMNQTMWVVGGPTYGGVDKLAPFSWKVCACCVCVWFSFHARVVTLYRIGTSTSRQCHRGLAMVCLILVKQIFSNMIGLCIKVVLLARARDTTAGGARVKSRLLMIFTCHLILLLLLCHIHCAGTVVQ